MFKKLFILAFGLLTVASALPLATQSIRTAQPELTTFDKAYTATLLGSAALGTALYAYAHIKARQARSAKASQDFNWLVNTPDVAFYDNIKHFAFALPVAIAFAPTVFHTIIAPWKGLHYTASTVYQVCRTTNWNGVSQGIQSLFAKFAQK